MTTNRLDDNCFSFSKSFYILGTTICLRAYGKNSEKAIDEAVARLYEINDKMSVFNNDSEISKINAYAGKAPQKVSQDTFFVIMKAIAYSKLSNGAFDPTIRPIMNLWGIGKDDATVPGINNINKTISNVNYNDVILDEKNCIVMLRHEAQCIDLGGIAKGYAADEVKAIFIKNNIDNAIIDLGGNIYALGSPPDNPLWKIGIQDPLKKRGEIVGALGLSNKSVVTSGGYERYFKNNGKKYHHIMDPKTGYPSSNGVISATIISDFSIDGDAIATCAFVMGLEKGLRLIESREGIDAILINNNRKVFTTSGIKDSLTLFKKEYSY
jgi:thiamine biosynthesis lipoprotein